MLRLSLAGLVMVGACTPAHLRFKNTNGGQIVAQTQVLPGSVWTPTDQDLAGARNTCLDELTMELEVGPLRATRITPAPRTEIHLFARHPTEMTSFLGGLSDADILAGLANFPKTERVAWHPRASVPGGFPRVPVAAWPSAPGVSTSPPTQLPLSTSATFGNKFAVGLSTEISMCHPQGQTGLLQPGASLKTATLFNRGGCRRELAIGEFIADGNAMLVDALKTMRHPGIGRIDVIYSIIQAFLSPTGTGLSEPVPGLVLFLHYVARDLLGNAPSDVVGAVRYDFGVDANGRVTITPHEIRWSYSGIWGPLSSDGPGWHGALTRPDGEMVKQVNELIAKKQLLAPQAGLLGAALTGGNFACSEQTFVRKCSAAAAMVGDVVGKGARARKDSSGNPLFTNDEVNRMLCAIGDATGCQAIGADAAAALRRRWVCTTSPASSEPYCDMVIPVQRITALPDNLGVVFFDTDDFDNAAYALEAGTSALCAKDAALPASRAFPSTVLRD
jgi:hypothetical protein